MRQPDPGPLRPDDLAMLRAARRATLTTIDATDGRPRSVPICFALLDDVLWSPLDEKPKASADPRTLRRVANLLADPRATILVDRWDEDWSLLAFLELECRGALVEPGGQGHAAAIHALRDRYTQYLEHRLEERPLLRFSIVGRTGWTAAPG